MLRLAMLGLSLWVTSTIELAAQDVIRQFGVRASSTLNLRNVVRAKLDDSEEEPKLVLMLPSFRMEKKEGLIAVTKMRQEQRVRMVNVDGEQVQQAYTVTVPYQEMVQDPEVPVAAGDKPKAFDVERFTFYDLTGEELDVEEVAERLDSLQAVFLLEGMRGEFRPLGEPYRGVLRPDCVVITTKEFVKENPNVQRAPGRR